MTVTETRARERMSPRAFVCENNRWVWLFPFLLDAVNAISFAGYPLAALHFGATPFQIGLLGCMATVTYVLACLTIGDASDRWGRRQVLFAGAWGYALSFAVAGCSRSVAGLLLAAALLGIAGGLLWPTLEAAVGDAFGHGPLGRGLLLFNIGWTTGMTLGAWGGGRLSDVGALFPFQVGLAIMLLTILLMYFWEPAKPDAAPADAAAATTTAPDIAEHFLMLARMGNCFAFFGVATLRALFAPLGAQLHFSGSLIGALIALITLGQAAAFVPLARSQRWQYRMLPLVASQLILAGALLAIVFVSSPVLLCVLFTTVGAACGVTYTSSLFYGLNRPAARGKSGALHEAVLGSGATAGPLLGGVVAQTINLRSPYWLAALTVMLCLAAQCGLHARVKRR